MQGPRRWKTTSDLPARPAAKPDTTVVMLAGVQLMEVVQPEGIAKPLTTRVFPIDGPLKVYIVSFVDLESYAVPVDNEEL